MSLKAELETWAAALKAYDDQDFEKSLDLFSRIADSSKILTNIGLIYATLGEHEAAVERFLEATQLDNYLAVAYFQCGVSNFLLTRYELAYKDFEEALQYLRGNQDINYEQLGLKFKLFSAEVMFNKGLSQIYLGRLQAGMADMEEASRNKATDEHNVIDDAIRDRGEGYTVFSIPVGILYRPSEKKLKNAVTKDYMGKAKLVASSDPSDIFTTFSGSTRLNLGISPSGIYVDRLNESTSPTLARSATFPAPVDGPSNLGVGRANTTANTLSNTGESRPPGPGNITRNKTTLTTARASPNATIGGPVRGLSVRRAGNQMPGSASPPPPAPLPKDNRLTDFYDNYLESYGDNSTPPPLPPLANSVPAPPDRVAAWARNNSNDNYNNARGGSRSAPTSQYSASTQGGGTLRRKTTRRTAPRRIQSSYEEEEEGYVSGEYDDGPFELIKIRVKLHYQDDIRGMTLDPQAPFEEFMDKVTSKFGKSIGGLGIKFKDEDGGKVTLRDESDYELAIETARESSKGKPEGKLELWCTEL